MARHRLNIASKPRASEPQPGMTQAELPHSPNDSPKAAGRAEETREAAGGPPPGAATDSSEAVTTTPPPPAPDAVAEESLRTAEAAIELLNEVRYQLEELNGQHRQSLEELQQAAVELGIAAASWILGVAVEDGQFAVDDLIRQGLRELSGNEDVVVELHPEDHALLKQLKSDEQPPLPVAVQVRSDPRLKRGSCRIRSGRQTLLTEFEDRLEEIRTCWLEQLRDTQTERRRDESQGGPLRRFPDRRETA